MVPASSDGCSHCSKGLNLELAGAPPGLRRWQEVLVLRQPEIEIAVGIEALDRLTQKPLEATEKLIDLG